jgi:hypothetical protein
MSTVDRSTEPLRATGIAHLAVDPTAGDGVFLPWRSGIAHFAEAHAVCGRGEGHEPPDAECDCGFAAAYDVAALLDLIEPTIAELAGAAVLDVDLLGRRHLGDALTRAGAQHVLGAGVLRWCAECRPEDLAVNGPAHLLGAERTVGLRVMHQLVTRCEAHGGAGPLQPYTLADAAGLLRTEVTWAPDEVVAAMLDRRRGRLVCGQRRGPVLGERRIGQLRMGQVGFTSLDSIRLDDSGRLWADVDGPAPQRPLGDAFVAVHRAVDLALELIVPVNAAERIDAVIGRARPPLLGRREQEVRRIEGMEHLPRLVAVWARGGGR